MKLSFTGNVMLSCKVILVAVSLWFCYRTYRSHIQVFSPFFPNMCCVFFLSKDRRIVVFIFQLYVHDRVPVQFSAGLGGRDYQPDAENKVRSCETSKDREWTMLANYALENTHFNAKWRNFGKRSAPNVVLIYGSRKPTKTWAGKYVMSIIPE